MRILRSAVVLVLLGLTLGAPWASAAASRSEKPVQKRPAAQGGAELLVWSFLARLGLAQGKAAPLAVCSAGEAGCRLDPWGGTQNQNTDAGCRIDPLGQCMPDH
jgi:hypothetical protein